MLCKTFINAAVALKLKCDSGNIFEHSEHVLLQSRPNRRTSIILLAWSMVRSGHRVENKHYFSVLYLTFDFESKDLKTLLWLTVRVSPAVNYLKVVAQTTLSVEDM